MSRASNISRVYLVFGCDIRSIFNQQLHHFHLAFNATNMERSSSILEQGEVATECITELENVNHKISHMHIFIADKAITKW